MSEANAELEDWPGKAEGLLPPSAVPLPPDDMKHREKRWIDPPVMPKEGESRYFVLEQPYIPEQDVPFDWPNFDMDRRFGPSAYGVCNLNELAEAPKFVSNRKPPKQMIEFLPDSHGYYRVSERIMDVFRRYDPEAISWHIIDWRFKDGALPEQPYYLMNVQRKIPVIDFANSRVCYGKSKGYNPHSMWVGPAKFLPNINSSFHIFDDDRRVDRFYVSYNVAEHIRAMVDDVDIVRILDPGYSRAKF